MEKRPDIYIEIALLALQRIPRFMGGRSLEVYLDDELCRWSVPVR
jgi:hypothetical protein